MRPWLEHGLVAALAIAVGVSFGLSYGLETHTSYLLHPLREIDPEFLRFDWLAAQTELVHKSFALFVRALSFLGPLPWTVALANVALVAIFILGIYAFLYANLRRDSLVAIALFMFFLLIGRTTSIADSHILTVRLEPSALAGSAVTMGFLLMIMGRYAWSGVVIAVAGFVHTNYLLLDFIFFGLAQVAFGRGALVRRLILQLGPSLLPLGLELPMLYAIATDPLAEDARRIITFIRAPHHELPLTHLPDFLDFAGWHLLALSSIGVAGVERAVFSRLLRTYFACTGVVVLALLMTTVVVVPHIAQLRFFRMAPISILLGQLIIAIRIAPFLARGAGGGLTVTGWRVVAATLGAGAIVTYYLVEDRFLEAGLMIVGLALVAVMTANAFGGLGRILPGIRSAVSHPAGLSIVVLAAGLLVSTVPPKYIAGLQPAATGPFYKRYNVLIGDPRPVRELFAWARSTPRESQFLIPPNLKSFRLLAERAVVVDWQTTPWKPFELVEWYRRIRRVSGMPDLRTVEEAEAGYARMDRKRMASLEKEFGVDYAVFKKPFDTRQIEGQIEGQIAFMNESYIVVKLRDEALADRERS